MKTLDTIELNVLRNKGNEWVAGPRYRFVRSHITHWFESDGHCYIVTTDRATIGVIQSFEMVTHLLTSDEEEDRDEPNGIIDPRD